MTSLKVAFAGSPEFAATILQRLQQSAHPASLVLTQPDRPKGRGRKLMPNPVKAFALEQGLVTLQPESLRDETAHAALIQHQPDVLVVAAYGLLLPESVLNIPKYGCINVHASLLPRWRGAAPIERAVMAGDQETGVAIMQMEKGLDTGPVFASRAIAISDAANISALEHRLASAGAELLLQVLDQLPSQPTPQPDTGISYAHKLVAKDRVIRWEDSADAIARQIWALEHRMPAMANVQDTQVQILEASVVTQPEQGSSAAPGELVDSGKKRLIVACGQGFLEILRLQVNRGKGLPMDASAAKNGYGALFRPGNVMASGGSL